MPLEVVYAPKCTMFDTRSTNLAHALSAFHQECFPWQGQALPLPTTRPSWLVVTPLAGVMPHTEIEHRSRLVRSPDALMLPCSHSSVPLVEGSGRRCIAARTRW